MANPLVAHIAGQILNAHRSEQTARLRRELAQARKLFSEIHPRNTFEQERLEVLEGAVECLDSPVEERARAAVSLLEQLAGQLAKSSSISARRAPVLTI